MQLNMHEAKSQLSKIAEKAHSGETVVIAKAGIAYVDLVPHVATPPRKPGRFKDVIEIAADFDDTPQTLIDAFEGDL